MSPEEEYARDIKWLKNDIENIVETLYETHRQKAWDLRRKTKDVEGFVRGTYGRAKIVQGGKCSLCLYDWKKHTGVLKVESDQDPEDQRQRKWQVCQFCADDIANAENDAGWVRY